jgi:hypothetical protein
MAKRHPAKRQERLARVIDFDEEEARQLRTDAATDPNVLIARGIALNRAARLFHEAGRRTRGR